MFCATNEVIVGEQSYGLARIHRTGRKHGNYWDYDCSRPLK